MSWGRSVLLQMCVPRMKEHQAISSCKQAKSEHAWEGQKGWCHLGVMGWIPLDGQPTNKRAEKSNWVVAVL